MSLTPFLHPLTEYLRNCFKKFSLTFIKKFVILETKGEFVRLITMNKDIDKDFIGRLKSGDKRAFEKLFIEYKNMLYTIVNRMVYNKNKIDDLVSDIFVKIYKNIYQFDGRSKLSTWMYRIAYNHCLDHIRKAKSDPLESYEPLDSMFNLSSNGPDAEKMVLKEERARVLYALVDSMPERYRMALNFYYFEGISYNDIGEIMGIPMGTVKTYLFRAKVYLREKMKKSGVL